MRRLTLYLTPIIALLISTAAQAAPGPFDSWLLGVTHPLSGADHLLVMVAVGVWSALAGGRALWVWPAVFVGMMLTGFAAASAGFHLPLVEPIVASSVIVLGLLVALAIVAPVWMGAALVAAFALFHGHAHGTEVGAASFPLYAAGFALATAALHAFGICLGVRWWRNVSVGRRSVHLEPT